MLCSLFRKKKNEGTEVIGEIIDTAKPSSYHFNHKKWFSQDFLLLPKDFNYILTLLDKCIKYCTKPEVDLKNNPPYLPGTLRSFQTEILGIIERYNSDLEELSRINFFRVSLWTLVKHCQDILRLFRNSKNNTVCDETSAPRQRLTQISLLLSHLLHALLALFPNRFYSPELFRITKSDAADWWNSHFGERTTVVEWKDFFHVFSKINYITDVTQITALRKTISVTGNGHVSIYDFDVFVRLFQPWSHIVECWQETALRHPGCVSLATYEQVACMLSHWQWKPGPGTYVFRFSCTRPGQWAIGYVDRSGRIFQTIVQHNKPLAVALLEGEQAGLYRYPSGRAGGHDPAPLRKLLRNLADRQQQEQQLGSLLPLQHSVHVSREQHEAYQRIDSTFELCKICSQHNKNVRLEPCGHLLCGSCLSRWQKTFPSNTCPFCRLEIRGLDKVELIPFEQVHQPVVPPRHTSVRQQKQIAAVAKPLQLLPNRVNYAQLEWNPDPEIDEDACHYDVYTPNYLNEQSSPSLSSTIFSLQSDGAPTTSLQSPTTDSISTTAHINNHNNSTSTEVTTSSFPTSSTPPPPTSSPSSNEAIKKLLTITKNDLNMSKEILKYFTPRSIITNS